MASRRGLFQHQTSNLSPASSSHSQASLSLSPSPLRNIEGRARDPNAAGSNSNSGFGSGIGSLLGLGRLNSTNNRPILPPLPPEGPSPPGRSSSPRYHSQSSSVVTWESTLSRNSNASAPGNSDLSTPSRHPLSPSAWHDAWMNNFYNWEEVSSVNDDDLVVPDSDFLDEDEDELVAAFLNASSPSTYPPFTINQPSPVRPASHAGQVPTLHQLPSLQAATSAPASASALPPVPGTTTLRQSAASSLSHRVPDDPFFSNPSIFSPPSRSTTQLTNSSGGDSQHTYLTNDIFNESLFTQTPDTSFSDAMPSARSRADPASPAGHQGLISNKRRRTTPGAELRPASRQSAAGTTTALNPDDDLFGESPPRPGTGVDSKLEDYATIDLTEATEVPEELKKPEVDNRTKLAAFQCVICMDDVTNLTITHCGHMYCAQCLHSSLNVEATRGKCPMCRNKIDMKPRAAYTSKTKGFWHLELKLMTATRKGKRKADSLT